MYFWLRIKWGGFGGTSLLLDFPIYLQEYQYRMDALYSEPPILMRLCPGA